VREIGKSSKACLALVQLLNYINFLTVTLSFFLLCLQDFWTCCCSKLLSSYKFSTYRFFCYFIYCNSQTRDSNYIMKYDVVFAVSRVCLCSIIM